MNNFWVHDFGQFKMVLDKTDLDFSRQVMMLGKYATESHESQIFENQLKKDQTVLDLGANIGYYSLLARSKVGPNGKIFSFEPSEENVSLIKKSIAENRFTNIIVVEAAVSDNDGYSELFLSPFYKSEHSLFEYNYSSGEHKGNKKKIKLVSIDSFLEKTGDLRVDIIKMDVEGSEKKSLDGMKKTIEFNKRLTLITEFWPQGFVNAGIESKEFLEILISSGFNLYHIDEFLQKTYPVTVNEMLQIAKERIKKPVETTKENQAGRWYTNLLCIK